MNRGFLYGDGFFDTLKIYKGVPLFWSLHWERNKRTASYLMFDSIDEANVKNDISAIAQGESGRLRITFYRDSEGKYTPHSDRVNWHINFESGPHGVPFTVHPPKAFEVSEERIVKHEANRHKLIARHIQVLAAKKQRNPNDALLLLNDYGKLSCGLSGNLFIKKSGRWMTPGLSEGALQGTIREWLIQNKKADEKVIGLELLNEAEGAFISNSIMGIQPLAIHQRKSENEISEIIQGLNASALNSIADFQGS